MNLRNSPISRTPPKNLMKFPDTMVKGSPPKSNNKIRNSSKRDSSTDDSQEQFQMDM
ncbi:UNVERIFIED_CONTAM: hypothetical protein PYX00_003437 [Menopon gallinae]|uniref:Uncharacterized protein n=1 Tax=Menopon gallinae TaxID=328185 RepID=A0AAW2I0A5_9NEOP